ncbi:enoyl-CoA hydratase/isomerase family protein [Brevundimonas sp.]|uniref:enoyl-CoA hydratase/isomerase family protein n=1 Tax=Brevundimonas sp. TaxID=1871086 RepID=UPI001A34A705|nr:enoyl-CoA hydratase/isomerase family protein [Brevundimonas sp.]MBJ7483879.1 enoyl-CoA hydratase/isomerase family protein [Brevundimonas sp.]
MPYKNILIEKQGPALWITLNRPDALNSLSSELAAEIGAAIELGESDPAVHALVFSGAGRAFCAGADLISIGGNAERDTPHVSLGAFLNELGKVFSRIEASPLPVIAAVNGLALAGGLELVLCCDLVIASHDAKFGDAHANYGLLPGGGGSVRLPRKIGMPRAAYLMMTGKSVSAAEMKEAGLVAELAAPEDLVQRAQALAETLAEKSRPGLSLIKEMVLAAQDASLETSLRRELEIMQTHSSSGDMAEGLAAFREKRKPQFTDR